MTPAPKVRARPKGLDWPGTTRVIKLMSSVNTHVYRLTGGRIGKNWRIGAGLRKPVPICLLTTTGRKSGRARTVPLCFLRDDDRIVLVASQGGLPANPQWYHNITANPAVEIEIGQRHAAYRAHTADQSERARLWPALVDLYADYASYQSWTEREIPVVICEPVD